jgi:3-oxoacyl-[acyl-carrier protein] reductase
MTQDSGGPKASQLLDGKIVVVTGASSGIGRAIALACAEAGADVALSYRASRAGADAVAEQIGAMGRGVLSVQTDITSSGDLAHLSRSVQERFGRADVWINNAGADILTGPGAEQSRMEKLDMLLAVDLRGTMVASWTAATLMRAQPQGGSIINMSWDGVLRGLGGENPELFSAAKGGVLGFSRSLARSLAPTIRVNVLGPGWIETAFGESASTSFKEKIQRQIPLGRWGKPEDVAGAAVYLASDLASYVTGQMILVNGGDVM